MPGLPDHTLGAAQLDRGEGRSTLFTANNSAWSASCAQPSRPGYTRGPTDLLPRCQPALTHHVSFSKQRPGPQPVTPPIFMTCLPWDEQSTVQTWPSQPSHSGRRDVGSHLLCSGLQEFRAGTLTGPRNQGRLLRGGVGQASRGGCPRHRAQHVQRAGEDTAHHEHV